MLVPGDLLFESICGVAVDEPDSADVWRHLLGVHRTPRDVERLVPLLEAAGITAGDLKEVLADPTPLLSDPRTDHPTWPWLSSPIAVALASAEAAASAAHTQLQLTQIRAAAVSEAVADSTVRDVAGQLGIRPQMVSRLHSRGASLFDVATAIIRTPLRQTTTQSIDDGDES